MCCKCCSNLYKSEVGLLITTSHNRSSLYICVFNLSIQHRRISCIFCVVYFLIRCVFNKPNSWWKDFPLPRKNQQKSIRQTDDAFPSVFGLCVDRKPVVRLTENDKVMYKSLYRINYVKIEIVTKIFGMHSKKLEKKEFKLWSHWSNRSAVNNLNWQSIKILFFCLIHMPRYFQLVARVFIHAYGISLSNAQFTNPFTTKFWLNRFTRIWINEWTISVQISHIFVSSYWLLRMTNL